MPVEPTLDFPPRVGWSWIVSPAWDLLLLIGSPLVIFPALIFVARRSVSPDLLWLLVFAFCSLGHHLPGMLRAYGDRALFAEYRLRFLLAPPLLLAINWGCFVRYQLHGMELLLLCWSTWHILMQTYGLMRIYDRRVGRATRCDAWCDFGACIAVFGIGFVCSDVRMFGFLETLWLTGVPICDPFWIESARHLVLLLSGAALLLLALRTILRGWQADSPTSGPKLLLLGTTAWLYWSAGQLSVDLLVGVAMFEVFHAVQYYLIVWYYNHRRVEKSSDDFGPLAFLFRGGSGGVAAYFTAIAAYGSLGFIGRGGNGNVAARGAAALFATSAMLHFYYDGFIWKLRQPNTGSNLRLAADGSQQAPTDANAGWRWTAVWVLLAILIPVEYQQQELVQQNSQQRLRALAAVVPRLPEVQARMSHLHLQNHDPIHALTLAESAVARRPKLYDAQLSLGNAQLAGHEPERASITLARAIALRPTSCDAWLGLGLAQIQLRQWDRASESLQNVLRWEPKNAQALFQLANLHYAEGQPGRAVELLDLCTQQAPQFAEAWNLLGACLYDGQHWPEAAAAYASAVQLDPDAAESHYNLGLVYLAMGELSKARAVIRRASDLGLQPSPEVLRDLGP